MTPLIFLAVLGVASAGPFTGYAPEVQAERARFFQAFRAAQAAAAPQQALYHHAAPVQPKWTGPVAATVPAGVDGTITPVSDTQEVSAARNAFLNAYNAQVRATVGAAPTAHSYTPTYHHAPAVPHQSFHHAAPVQPKWTGPVAATVPAGLPGSAPQVADTAEVSAARNAFLNAYNAQVRATVGAAPTAHSYTPTYHHAPAVPQHTFHHAAPAQPKWTGPVAATVPAGLPGSAPQVADTPEVAAAKQAFFNTYNRQAAAAAPPSRHYY
ncbi:cuticle protein CP1499-like isoform X2 [Penaeus japonicus]|uniref:cuticle protein CP1499-like isoform X1 n=1 Tax=Penaeus japonicus TaxID=27405 RepID=UPI001C70D16C|nr:cuticle protein CP1499-like isoform X1 [Penaeus japonicus]XP_042867836.1 cuticle protein CP1499-like isoform X2 [Penaeus japonicus]